MAATDLYKSYRKGPLAVPVLRGLSMSVRQGEFLAIVGQSGSGKSTLLHLLGTLDAPDEARSISRGGGSTTCPPAAATRLRNRQFGMIFQFYHLLPELTHAGERAGAADDRPRDAGPIFAAAASTGPGRPNCWRWSAWATG